MCLISVILGTKSMQARVKQAHALLNWGFGHYARKIVMPANQMISMISVLYGKTDNVNLIIPKALVVLVPIAD